MKLIGITQRIDIIESYGEVREALDIKWHDLLLKCGYTPLILSAAVIPTFYFEKFALDGLLLTGGNDLATVKNTAENKMRDDFENQLIKKAINADIPVLGVCRGMQVIGEFFGCSLKKCEGHVAVNHNVTLNKASQLYKIAKKNDVVVNSYHNYSLNNIEKSELVTSAISEDGIVEAVEHERHKIFGHMWHPERESPCAEVNENIIRTIFE